MYTEISVNQSEQTTPKMRGKSKKSKPTNQKGKNVERKFIKGGGQMLDHLIQIQKKNLIQSDRYKT